MEEMLLLTSSVIIKQNYASVSFYDNKIFDDVMRICVDVIMKILMSANLA